MNRFGLAAIMALAGFSAAPVPALAQMAPERCAAIGPASERLACYDSIFRSGQFTGGGSQTDADQGLWTSGIEVSNPSSLSPPWPVGAHRRG